MRPEEVNKKLEEVCSELKKNPETEGIKTIYVNQFEEKWVIDICFEYGHGTVVGFEIPSSLVKEILNTDSLSRNLENVRLFLAERIEEEGALGLLRSISYCTLPTKAHREFEFFEVEHFVDDFAQAVKTLFEVARVSKIEL